MAQLTYDTTKIKVLMFERSARERRRHTYQDVADGTGLTWSAIERYANGRVDRANEEWLGLIADHFGVPLNYFLVDDGDELKKVEAARGHAAVGMA